MNGGPQRNAGVTGKVNRSGERGEQWQGRQVTVGTV